MTDTDTDLQSKLTECESIIQQLVTKLQETVDENDRLQAVVAKLTGTDNDAHSTLRRLYLDETQSPNTRVRAAQAALNVEKPRLESVPPPLDLVAEPYEPLAVVVERQRKRCDAMQALPLAEREALIKGVVRHGGNGQDDDTAS
jgi:hypothetical protein